MALVMCDVDCGSNTPSMVKKVLAWKAADPEASKSLWDGLQRCNEHLGRLLTAPSSSLADFQEAFAQIRARIRDMGDRSGVPIEPPEQTQLLDAASKVQGVAGGVVPGAGGYDAIVLLVKDDAETKGALEKFLQEWSLEKGSNVRLLGTKGELEGARVEDGHARVYTDWV